LFTPIGRHIQFFGLAGSALDWKTPPKSQIVHDRKGASYTMAPTTSYTAAPLKGPINLPPLPMMVHVTAPATLPAGYTFEATINDDESKIINVEVVRNVTRDTQGLFIDSACLMRTFTRPTFV
jgi:hypothetical protein